MDIFGAQSHMKKLLAYVEKISESDARVYAKSRTRLKDLYDTCVHIESLISNILQDDMFEQSEDEFADLNKSVDDSSSISATNQDRKTAFKLYCEILHQTSVSSLLYSRSLDCAKLIWYWFNNRFILSKPTCPGFRYSMYKLPEWIGAIVLCYGRSIENNKDIEFIKDFRQWCDDLVDTGNNNYPLPYDVYSSIKSNNNCNLTAVVLWDMLLDGGYNILCNKSPEDIYLSEELLYEYCGKYDPSVLDEYSHYSKNPAILVRCNLVGGTI